jgi:hypothetical protein
MRRVTPVIIGILVMVVVGASAGWFGRGDSRTASTVPGPRELELRLELAANLESFQDCDEVVAWFKEQSLAMGAENAGALYGGRIEIAVGDSGSASRAAEGAGGAAGMAGLPTALADQAGSAPAGDDGFSATNVQERGVDEPDTVKTDGRLVVVVHGGRLHVLDAGGGSVALRGSVDLPEGEHEVFLRGSRAVVLTRAWDVAVQSAPAPGGAPDAGGPDTAGSMPEIYPGGAEGTTISMVDVGDAANPRVVDSATFEGSYVSARLRGDTVRVVLGSGPSILPMPLGIEGAAPMTDETQFKAAIESSTLDAWLPNQVVEQPDGSTTAEPLVACDAVARPPEPSGVGTVTVLTIDANGSAKPIDTDTVVGDAQTVYASDVGLVVGTSQWRAPDARPDVAEVTTELHAFDTSSPGSTSYLASGRVRGQLLNQWSLSEFEGRLRVATTDGSPWAEDGGPGSSESFMTVLERDGDALTTVGQIGGLGRGETIHAVRFFGSLAFVVTFRQTDPLYAIDLSDPREPRLAGELKVPGYSAYLHPVGEGRLLGVGQDATAEGETTGTQVSLFDVADLAAMRRIANETVPNSSSTVEWDHRAFLWWGRAGLAVVPLEVWSPEPTPLGESREIPVEGGGGVDLVDPVAPADSGWRGVLLVRVTGDGLSQVARVDHRAHIGDRPDFAGYVPPISRAFVIGETLYTVSDAGVLAGALDGSAERGWAAFPVPEDHFAVADGSGVIVPEPGVAEPPAPEG